MDQVEPLAGLWGDKSLCIVQESTLGRLGRWVGPRRWRDSEAVQKEIELKEGSHGAYGVESHF